MSDARIKRDTEIQTKAASLIVDGRPFEDFAEILVTLDGVVLTILLALFDRDSRKAAAMLNEGMVPSIEKRLALYDAVKRGEADGRKSNP